MCPLPELFTAINANMDLAYAPFPLLRCTFLRLGKVSEVIGQGRRVRNGHGLSGRLLEPINGLTISSGRALPELLREGQDDGHVNTGGRPALAPWPKHHRIETDRNFKEFLDNGTKNENRTTPQWR